MIIKKSPSLSEFKNIFIELLKQMPLKDVDENLANELLAYRNFRDFENIWDELIDNSPEIYDCHYNQIINYAKKIDESLPKTLHHKIVTCIIGDFKLIATYLIAGHDNRYIASLCLSYVNRYLPGDQLEESDKSLQEVFMELKNKHKVSG